MFPDVELVRSVQQELDKVIEEGVGNIVQLLRSAESPVSSNTLKVDEDAFEARNRQKVWFGIGFSIVGLCEVLMTRIF
jgi:hypothetical protein